MPSFVGLGYHQPLGWPKTLSFFVCLSVCVFVLHAFERQSLFARFRHEDDTAKGCSTQSCIGQIDCALQNVSERILKLIAVSKLEA